MVALINSLRVDLEREAKGDWVPSLQFPGVEYRVSSLHTPAYQQALELMTMRLSRKYKSEPVPPTVRVAEQGKLYAQHILHDWRGFDEPYSAESALARLVDPAFRPLTADIISCAMRIGEPDVEYSEALEKNSVAPSSGSSSTKAR